jgi:hypothetical protein
VVERGKRADHAHHRVGQVLIVVGHLGKPFDLADHVVAEVADQTARHRRQLGQVGRPVRGEQVLERGEHAVGGRDAGGEDTVDRDGTVAQRQRGDRVPTDEGEAAPPLAVLDRLEEEALSVADELGERGDGCLQIGEQLGPHRYDGVLGGERVELLAAGADCGLHRGAGATGQPAGRATSNFEKKHVRLPVWQAPLPCWVTLNSSASPSQS